MIYNILNAAIYHNSRYELAQLLEDIYPITQDSFDGIEAFNETAKDYERLIDTYFPALPFSEERLAIFSRVYSEHGVISPALVYAVQSGNRALVLSMLKQVDKRNNRALQRRRFYEAGMFGGE